MVWDWPHPVNQAAIIIDSKVIDLFLIFFNGVNVIKIVETSTFTEKLFIFNIQKKNMLQAKSGDTVKVHYSGRLTDGTTFDSSDGRDPLEFKVGNGDVIKGFDEGVSGMSVGEKKTVHIPADEAYGQKDEDRIVEFPKANFPPDMEPEVGMQLNMTNGSGQVIPVIILEVGEETVILDANHPLAGQDLIFDIELVDIAGGSRIIMP